MRSEATMTQLKQVPYTYVMITDRPGAGSRILAPLGAAKVNLLAMSGFPAGAGKVQLDLVPENMAALKRVAKKEGWKLAPTKKAFFLTGADRPGAVASTLAKLAKRNIGVIAADAVSAGGNRYGMIFWVKPVARAKAAKAIGAR
jgi:hypothetical protein